MKKSYKGIIGAIAFALFISISNQEVKADTFTYVIMWLIFQNKPNLFLGFEAGTKPFFSASATVLAALSRSVLPSFR